MTTDNVSSISGGSAHESRVWTLHYAAVATVKTINVPFRAGCVRGFGHGHTAERVFEHTRAIWSHFATALQPVPGEFNKPIGRLSTRHTSSW